MRHFRGFQGSRSRSTPRPVLNSYKKVLKFAPASFAAGFNNMFLIQGLDGITPKQTSSTDGQVPTGAVVKFIEVQFAVNNAVSTPVFVNCTLQYNDSTQVMQDPDTIGGNAQRNQCLHMDLFSVGQNQNSTHKFKFKIPKKFQRIRDGRDWALTWSNSNSVNVAMQAIYKFYW